MQKQKIKRDPIIRKKMRRLIEKNVYKVTEEERKRRKGNMD